MVWPNWAHDGLGKTVVLNIAAITGGRNVPSARFRVRQYLPELLSHGVNLTEFQTFSNAYPPHQKWLRPAWAALRLAEMSYATFRSRSFDITLLQREMLSTIETFERWTGCPRVLDVDDSIHLYRNGSTSRKIATYSDRIICGNHYLAEIYQQWNNNVVLLPTAIDTKRYSPRLKFKKNNEIILGWIGTSANLRFLQSIEPALAKVLKLHTQVKIHIVCDKSVDMPTIDPNKIIFTKWSDLIDVDAIQSFDIGLMPLIDSPWTRGKCSFKMIQYMACGVAVAVSPVGMNSDILKSGEIGIGASNLDEWVQVLDYLISNDVQRNRLGLNGREVAERDFSVKALAPKLASYLSF